MKPLLAACHWRSLPREFEADFCFFGRLEGQLDANLAGLAMQLDLTRIHRSSPYAGTGSQGPG